MEKNASVKIVLDPQSGDEKRVLKLRIIFDRKTYLRTIGSDVLMTEEEFMSEKKNEVKSALKKARMAKSVADAICEELGENFTIQEFGYRYKKEVFGKEVRRDSAYTLNKVYELYCEEHTLSPNTIITYNSSVHWIERFRPDCLMSDITPGFIVALKAYMNQQNNYKSGKDMSISTINMYFRGLKAICEYAIEKKIIRDNPFNGLNLESGDRPKTALTLDEWNAFLRYCPETGSKEEFAHDMIMLEFSLGGPNMADILGLTNDCIKSDMITYTRQKSKGRGRPQVVSVPLRPEAKRIIEKYGHIDASHPRNYVLPYYSGTTSEKARNQRRDAVLKKVNEGIRVICSKLGIGKFTTYNIRHTYAIFARDLGGLGEAQIQQMLGHKNIATTQRYLKGITAPLVSAHNDFVDIMMKGEQI